MAVTASTMNGVTKKMFGDINDSLPTFALMQERIPFKSMAKLGKEWAELIMLTRSHGVTYQRTNKQTIYNLNDAVSLTTKEATESGSEIVMREQIAYGMLAAAERAGDAAYASAIKMVLKSILETHRFRIELNALYGQSAGGVGIIESETDGTTTSVYTLTSATWASGIWSQMEGAWLDVYDPTLTTKRNTNAAVVVTTVLDDSRTLNVSGNASDLDATVAGDILVPYGSKGETMYGIDAIARNTGTLFGIDASLYSVWKANSYAVGGPCTINAISKALSKAIGRGLIGKKVTVMLNDRAWQDIANDSGGLRRWNESQASKVEQGTHALTFYGANNNFAEIVSHPMVKQSEGFVFLPENFIRGGESDIQNGLPGSPTPDDFFHDLEGKAGCEVRNFSSQFLMSTKPSQLVKMTGITPTGAT